MQIIKFSYYYYSKLRVNSKKWNKMVKFVYLNILENELQGKFTVVAIWKRKPKREMWMYTSKWKTILNYKGGLQFEKSSVK